MVINALSWYFVLPYRRTTKRHSDFSSMVIFRFLLRKFVTQTWFCNCQQYLCLFHIVFEYIPSIHDQGKMLVLPKSTSLFRTFHIGSMFCFFPANSMSSTYKDKNNPCSRCTNKHSQSETFSLPYYNRIFSNCWEELACESPRSGALLSTRFSLNSCSHSGISEFSELPRSKSGSSVLCGFWIFGWLGQRITPFFLFNMFTWHRYWIGIYPNQVFPCSSLTVTWHSRGWWGWWIWGRRRMINFLPWKCHGCWRGKTGRRTRWQTRNHDRNEVLHITLYPNTVFNEMWFLTVDLFIRISVLIAKLSDR